MPDYCTCGAQLPPDARFCHKCGKPQRDEPVFEEEPEEFLPNLVSASQPDVVSSRVVIETPPEITFRNKVAVRTCLFVATLALLVSSVPLSPMLPFVWMTAGGALSVFLYNRRTGSSLSIRNGARMGWMTGVFSFLISMVLLAIGLVLIAGQWETLSQMLREQSGLSQEVADRAIEMLSSPAELVLSAVMGFMMFSLLAAVGGALGARVFSKN